MISDLYPGLRCASCHLLLTVHFMSCLEFSIDRLNPRVILLFSEVVALPRIWDFVALTLASKAVIGA